MGKGEIARYEQFLLFPQCFQKACFSGASKGVIVWHIVRHYYLVSLTHYQTTNFRLFRTESLHSTISNLTKMAENDPNRKKTLWEKEKLLITSNFFLFPQCFQKACFPGASKGVIVWHIVRHYYLVSLTHYQTTNFRLFQTESLHSTISNLMKMAENDPNRKKTLWEKEKLLVTSKFLLFPQCFQKACFRGPSKGVIVWHIVRHYYLVSLTHYQTTNFRLFQTESLHSTISNLMKMAENGPNRKKTLWEKEKLLVTSKFLLFPQCFQKACFPGASKGVIVWHIVRHYYLVSLTHYQTTNFRLFQTESLHSTISNLMKMAENGPNRKKTLWEKEKLLVTSKFLLFPQCFQKACFPGASKGVIVWHIVRHYYLVSLTHYQTTNFRLFQTESLHSTISNLMKMAENGPNRKKTLWEKEKLLVTSKFLLFPQCFQKACFPGAPKGVIVWEWVKDTV